ncbi:hypothetical protein CY34DRAFT_473482 [Suillus luteus UH-Slu-Lm8-n1]|uniref:Secreted protein n=1 Tax=Suillus luteus UH-Slu-Lm8-n1 TaxID=930992 RepID=A0A0D0A7B4_9AGAM|nr:hypothetical protein CY34DRAFT_473482 [Suillus luteus UH-Slu-Lm8-n1]
MSQSSTGRLLVHFNFYLLFISISAFSSASQLERHLGAFSRRRARDDSHRSEQISAAVIVIERLNATDICCSWQPSESFILAFLEAYSSIVILPAGLLSCAKVWHRRGSGT